MHPLFDMFVGSIMFFLEFEPVTASFWRPKRCMMSLVDSKAAFEQRCQDIGAGPLLALLHTNGIDTFAGLAYACGTPQEKVPDAVFDQFAEKVAGPNPSMGLKSQLRRLMFESSTYVIAQLKQAVTADEAPKKLPVAEKKARQSAQAARLVGVLIEREMVPSYELVDLAAEIATTNCITWISPGKCTSRESEIQHAHKDLAKVIRLEDSKLTTGPHEGPQADFASPLKFEWCMQRRGLAFDQSGLVSWAVHERWSQGLLMALARDPPAGFQRVAMGQVINADREAFLIMAAELKSVKPLPDGTLPMNKALESLRNDPRITSLLMALPLNAPVPSAEGSSEGAFKTSSRKRRARKNKQKQQPTQDASASGPVPPAELQGCFQVTLDNKIRWNFNLKCGCSESTTAS